MDRKLAKSLTNGTVLILVALFWAFAWRADHQWFERHIQRHYYLLNMEEERAFRYWRFAAVALGVAFVAARSRIVRWVERRGVGAVLGDVLRCSLAIPLSLVIAEYVLRKTTPPPPPPGTLFPVQVPDLSLIRPDDRLGWTHRSSYAQVVQVGGRDVSYAFNSLGDRVRSPDQEVDTTRPSVVFLGESIIAGHGLQFDETIPAQVERMTGLQSINLAVPGYGNDQSYQRFVDRLPSLPPLVAVVSLFLGTQLERLEWHLRPRLRFDDGTLTWIPPVTPFWADLRLATLWRNKMPYHDESEVAITREIFRRTGDLARARGATPLFVLFAWGPTRPLDAHDEAWLYRELFEDQGLPAIVVDVEHFMDDGHPVASDCLRIAEAIARALASRNPRAEGSSVPPAPL